jgi:hypothetical protein
MNDLFAYDTLSVEDRIALTALCMEYCWRIDFGHHQMVTELFTDDCVWERIAVDSVGGKFVGKAQMAEYWGRRARMSVVTRHMISNLRFLKDTATSARGWVTFATYVAEEGEIRSTTATRIAQSIDTYEKGGDGKWRFKTRKLEITFGAP